MDKWLTNKGIVYEVLATYYQEENRVSEHTSRTIIEMVRVPILEMRLDDTL